MSNISDRIFRAIQDAGLSYGEISRKTKIPKSALHRYATGGTPKVPIDRIEAIAECTGVSAQYLMGWDDTTDEPEDERAEHLNGDTKKAMPPKSRGVKIPVLGEVAAGVPIEAIKDILDYEEITPELARTGNFFALRILGDSMAPYIMIGDVVIVRQQPDADNGNIVIAFIGGENATCKKLMKTPGGVALVSINANYDPMVFTKKQVKELPVVVLGKVIEIRRKIDI